MGKGKGNEDETGMRGEKGERCGEIFSNTISTEFL